MAVARIIEQTMTRGILWSPDLVEESARTQALDEILQSVKAPAIR